MWPGPTYNDGQYPCDACKRMQITNLSGSHSSKATAQWLMDACGLRKEVAQSPVTCYTAAKKNE